MEKLRDGKNNLASFVSYVASFVNVENLAITSNLLVFETGLTGRPVNSEVTAELDS